MKLIIEGTVKEMADFIRELRSQPKGVDVKIISHQIQELLRESEPLLKN